MKFKELTTKSEAEIGKLLSDLKGELSEIHLKLKLNEYKDTSKLKKLKKDIARIMTFLQPKKN
jgi:ribosomal protein L29